MIYTEKRNNLLTSERLTVDLGFGIPVCQDLIELKTG